MPEAIILDTETTCLERKEPIEMAWLEVLNAKTLIKGEQFVERYKPTGEIGFGAMATHHIIPEDLEGCPPSMDCVTPEGVRYMIGHNVDFDWQVMEKPDVKRICTQALARAIYPECDSHRLIALMYYRLDKNFARAAVKDAHSALADVMNCHMILMCMMNDLVVAPTTWEELWALSEAARIPTKITFGKHAGTEIRKLPTDYIIWLLKQPNLDPYLEQAIRNRNEPGPDAALFKRLGSVH